MLLRGGGGTTAVLLRGDGVTVVDTKNPNFGAPIIAAVKELTRPAHHDDHQHALPRRPRERQRRVPGHRGHRPREHRREHAKLEAGRRVSAAERRRNRAFSSGTPTGTCQPAPSAIASRSARDRIRSSCTTSGAATRTAMRGSCSRRSASCTPATSSPGTTRFRFSTATTARAACRTRHAHEGARRLEQGRPIASSPGTAP